jgi:hypothetical protein
VNDKLRPQVKDALVYRGSDISSDHYLLISKIALWEKWRSIKPRQMRMQEEVYKVHLLQEESIRILYQWRLRQYFLNTPTKNELDEEWQNIK